MLTMRGGTLRRLSPPEPLVETFMQLIKPASARHQGP